jgi:hypothetical protein
MGRGGVLESKTPRAQIGEIARVDSGAHQAARRVCGGLKQVMTDLVGDRAAKNEPQAVILERCRLT